MKLHPGYILLKAYTKHGNGYITFGNCCCGRNATNHRHIYCKSDILSQPVAAFRHKLLENYLIGQQNTGSVVGVVRGMATLKPTYAHRIYGRSNVQVKLFAFCTLTFKVKV